jgi:hypothetical protein
MVPEDFDGCTSPIYDIRESIAFSSQEPVSRTSATPDDVNTADRIDCLSPQSAHSRNGWCHSTSASECRGRNSRSQINTGVRPAKSAARRRSALKRVFPS